MTPVETTEAAAQAQWAIEVFARKAHMVMIAIETLEDAFNDLADWPDSLDQPMSQLRAAGEAVATEAIEWAKTSNANLKSSPWE